MVKYNRKGSILIVAYLVLSALLILGGAFISRSVSDRKLFDIGRERLEAFYLAETGVDKALATLKSAWTYTGVDSGSLGTGQYQATVTGTTLKQIVACGYVPTLASARSVRCVEAYLRKPPGFFDYAIYSAGDVEFKGGSYDVDGKVIYADDIDPSAPPYNVSEDVTHEPSISPLARFDFAILRAIAVAQGNLYTAVRLQSVQTSNDTFPTTNSGVKKSQSRGCTAAGGGAGQAECEFWYTYPTDINDPATGVPNIVYVEGDMVLNGQLIPGDPDGGIIGGFFLVVGNVLTDPDAIEDTTLNGNGTVEGSIYTTGKFDINGGGGNLNVDGGVWCGSEAELSGTANVEYDGFKMDSIEHLVTTSGAGAGIESPLIQFLSWRDCNTQC